MEALSETPDPEAKDEKLGRLSSMPHQLYSWNKEESYSPSGLTQAVGQSVGVDRSMGRKSRI